MGTDPRNNQSSETSVDHESPDCSLGKSIPSAPAVSQDINSSSSAQPTQTRVFTLFKRLPAELRVLIWELACGPSKPSVHFLEPIAEPDAGRVVFWDTSRCCWRNDESPSTERTPIIHWEVSERTNDPCFQWPGRKLLSVCVEARRVFLDQRTTALTGPKEQTRAEVLDMVRSTDIICIRAGVLQPGYRTVRLAIEGERTTGFCNHDERPSPRRLALEAPAATHQICGGYWVPHWINHYGPQQKFMRFDRLEELYILDQDIKPRAQKHHDSMPSEIYIEAFEGHHGSKFVAIDPKDKQAVRSWIIPDRCWTILMYQWSFPWMYSLPKSAEDVEYSRGLDDRSQLGPKLRLLACVKGSSQTQHIDDESLNSDLPFN